MTRHKFSDLVEARLLKASDGYRAKNDELGGEGPVFLRSAYLQDQGFVIDKPDRFLSRNLGEFGKKVSMEGDTVVTTKGNSTGRVGFVRDNVAGAVYSPHLSYWRSLDHQVIAPRFLYYWACSDDFKGQLHGLAYATDMAPYLSLRDQMSLRITLPSINVQSEIAGLLGALDDKIELNRKTAATLEEMARALYRSWFVDFDPVRARAEGRVPAHMDAQTAALFPDSFGENGLPLGWRITEIGSELEILDSRRIPLSKPQRALRAGTVPYYGATSVMDYVDEAIFDEELLLLGEDGSVVRPDGTPFTQYIWGPAWVNNHAHVLRGRRLSVPQLKCFFDQADVSGFVNGAVQAKLNQSNMKRIPFLAATLQVHIAFDTFVIAWFSRIRTISEENRTLSTLRDTLLPRLMSGGLRVGAAREVIGGIG